MKRLTTIFIIVLMAFATFAQTSKSHSNSKVLYIDVPINQPNVNDCYGTSAEEIVIHEDWFKLYPNPNQGIFNLEVSKLKAGERMNIQIFNSSGALVHQTSEQAAEETQVLNLNLSTLAKGAYFVHIQVGRKKSVKRLTII